MFNKNDFINWAQTAQNDNKPMQDFRSSHFNPMKQVQQKQEAVQVEESKGKTLFNLAKPILKKAAVKTAEYGAVKGGEAAIDAVLPKPKPKPDTHMGEGIKGEIAGTATGAALGSVVPGVGTVVGGLVGGIAGGALGDAAGKGKAKSRNKPVDVHASYDARKEAGMRAMREFFGHQKKLGLGKDQVKQRAKQSQDAYSHSSSSGFKFGRPLPHQEPK